MADETTTEVNRLERLATIICSCGGSFTVPIDDIGSRTFNQYTSTEHRFHAIPRDLFEQVFMIKFLDGIEGL